MRELEQIGPRLRAARRARGWTLQQLADLALISPSTLSRLESGKRQPTLDLLLPLTRRLGISIEDLLQSTPPDPRVRRSEIRREGLAILPLAPEGAAVETYRVTFPPGQSAPEPRVHDGFEWLYVLSGRLRLRLGDLELVLKPGEAAEFDTRTPHSLSAAGARPAQIISIFNADGARIHTHGAGAAEAQTV